MFHDSKQHQQKNETSFEKCCNSILSFFEFFSILATIFAIRDQSRTIAAPPQNYNQQHRRNASKMNS